MPQAIPAIGAFFVKVFTAKAIGWVIARTIILNFALGEISKALAGKPRRSNHPLAQRVMIRSTVAPREIVYGKVRKSGALLHYGATGENNKYLWYVIAISTHQLQEMTDVWFDNDIIADADIDDGTGEVTGGKYEGKAYIWRLLGEQGQDALAELMAADPTWTSNHRAAGCGLLIVRLERDQETYPNGPPNQFFVLCKGKRVYDPRLDSTNGGSGSHRLADATTWAWSDNSILCRADYATSGSLYFDVATPVRRLGQNIPTGRIDWAVVAANANICDEDVALPSAATENRYTFNGVLSCVDSHEVNFRKIEDTCMGRTVRAGGKYRFLAGQYDAPTHTITDADLAGGWELIGNTETRSLANAYSGTYFDRNRNWAEVSCRVRTNEDYEDEDGGSGGPQQRLRTIDIAGVDNDLRAQRLCEIHLRATRDQAVVKFFGGPSLFKIAPWETFDVELAEMPSWMSGKTWRAHDIEINLANPPRVIVTAKVDSEATWEDLEAGDYLTPNSGAPTAQFETPDPVESLSATGVQDAVQLLWPAATVFFPHWRYEIWEAASGGAFSTATLVWEGIATGYRHPRPNTDIKNYWVRIRAGRSPTGAVIYSDTTPTGAGVAAAASAITAGFRLTANRQSHLKILIGIGTGSTTNTTTVTPIDPAGAVTYAWTRLSGSTKLEAINTTSATTGFRVVSGQSLADLDEEVAVFRCTGDDGPDTATIDVHVTFRRDDSFGS